MGNCTGKKAAKKAGEVNPPQVNDVQGQQEAVVPVVTPKKKKPSVPLPRTPVPPSSPGPGVCLYVAIFDYDARTNEDLTFKKGEYLEVSTANTQFDWWQAKSRISGKQGYIPSNYVAEVKTLEAEE